MNNNFPNGFKLYHAVAMVFVASLLISNTIAVKIISIGSLSVPVGIILFPIAYIINDVLVEVYGYKKAKSTIWWGFACLALMSFAYYLATVIPPAGFYEGNEAFKQIFTFVPRIGIASFLAYLVGSFANSIVMSIMKVKTKGKHLWMRTIGSTIVGEGIDSIVFNIVAFLGVFEPKMILTIALSGFILKVGYEIIFTPFTYLVVNKLKQYEGIDVFDDGIKYTV